MPDIMVPLTDAIKRAHRDYDPEAKSATLLKQLKEDNMSAVRRTVMESYALTPEQRSMWPGLCLCLTYSNDRRQWSSTSPRSPG